MNFHTNFSRCNKHIRSLATFNFLATIFFKFSTDVWLSTLTEKQPPVVVFTFNVICDKFNSVPHPICCWISCESLPILCIFSPCSENQKKKKFFFSLTKWYVVCDFATTTDDRRPYIQQWVVIMGIEKLLKLLCTPLLMPMPLLLLLPPLLLHVIGTGCTCGARVFLFIIILLMRALHTLHTHTTTTIGRQCMES